ncbi:hypothetical protein MYX77_04560 [Acidobacteriia bacterium AH_259_A11_L15]|nr:hypothetical protein [Acidobacteriia bacterium AH_259_A11_L15]
MNHGENRKLGDERERILRTAFYEKFPHVLKGLSRDFEELFDIARTYAALRKYEHTGRALGAAADLLVRYLKLRDGKILAPITLQPWFGDFTGHDPFLVEQLEHFSELHRSALAPSDVRLSLQVIGSLRYVATHSVKIRASYQEPGVNQITNLVLAYLYPAIEEATQKKLYDITLQGTDALSATGRLATMERSYLTSQMIIDDLQKLANHGIVQRKAFVTQRGVQAISQIMATSIAISLPRTHTLRHALDALKQIAILEVSVPQPWLSGSGNVQTALGPFLDLTSNTSLTQQESLAIRKLLEAQEKDDRKLISSARSVLEELNDGLWLWFSDVGAAAARTESFALYLINANIREIANQQLWLYEKLRSQELSPEEAWRQEEFGKKLLHDFSWLINATYWRIYEGFSDEVKTNLVSDFFGTLSQVGLRCIELGLEEEAFGAAQHLLSIGKMAVKKQFQHGYGPPRIAEHIARIGIFGLKKGRNELVQRIIRLLVDFQHSYLEKIRDVEELRHQLFNEITNLERERREMDMFADPTDAYFFSKIEERDVENFLRQLPQEIS